jgi:hypothetical protein
LNRREYFSSAALSTNKVVTRFLRQPDRANGSPAGDSREAINYRQQLPSAGSFASFSAPANGHLWRRDFARNRLTPRKAQ